jgi:hypothetical protein
MKPIGIPLQLPHLLIIGEKTGVKSLEMVPFQGRFRTVLLY